MSHTLTDFTSTCFVEVRPSTLEAVSKFSMLVTVALAFAMGHAAFVIA